MKLETIKAKGLEVRVLNNNQWIKVLNYSLPIKRFVHLYNDNLELFAIGVY